MTPAHVSFDNALHQTHMIGPSRFFVLLVGRQLEGIGKYLNMHNFNTFYVNHFLSAGGLDLADPVVISIIRKYMRRRCITCVWASLSVFRIYNSHLLIYSVAKLVEQCLRFKIPIGIRCAASAALWKPFPIERMLQHPDAKTKLFSHFQYGGYGVRRTRIAIWNMCSSLALQKVTAPDRLIRPKFSGAFPKLLSRALANIIPDAMQHQRCNNINLW